MLVFSFYSHAVVVIVVVIIVMSYCWCFVFFSQEVALPKNIDGGKFVS